MACPKARPRPPKVPFLRVLGRDCDAAWHPLPMILEGGGGHGESERQGCNRVHEREARGRTRGAGHTTAPDRSRRVSLSVPTEGLHPPCSTCPRVLVQALGLKAGYAPRRESDYYNCKGHAIRPLVSIRTQSSALFSTMLWSASIIATST